jgi:hypothetical protein
VHDQALDKMAREQRTPAPARPLARLPARLALALTQVLVADAMTKATPAVTSADYLADADQILCWATRRSTTLTLNPSVNKWLNGEEGWIDRAGLG